MIFQKTFLTLLNPKLGFSMKAQIIAIITGAAAVSIFAGGLNTNTNQSIAYQRHVMRYATTDNDAPIFNPAGTAFMEDGWHLSLNSQAFWQTRTIYTESPLFFFF